MYKRLSIKQIKTCCLVKVLRHKVCEECFCGWICFYFVEFSHIPCMCVISLSCILFPACAVSAMLSKVSASGISYVVRGDRADGAEVKGVTRFDVVLCQSELIEHALQLCHLLSPGLLPVSFNLLHTHTHTWCFLFSVCSMELSHLFSLRSVYLCGQVYERACVCVCVSYSVLYCALHGYRILNRKCFIFSLPTFIWAASLSCLFCSQLCSSVYHLLSPPSRASIVLLLWCLQHWLLSSCTPSAEFLDTWWMNWRLLCPWPFSTIELTAAFFLFLQPCQSSKSFALDAIHSLVRCGILIMEEVRALF